MVPHLEIIVTLAAVTALVFVSKKLKLKHKKRKGVSKKESKLETTEDDIWNNVIFFPDWFPEKEFSATRELIWYLEQANYKLDVCLYGFSFRMLQDVLINVAQRPGMKIRVLTDRNVRRKGLMMKNGIEMRKQKHLWHNPLSPSMALDLLHHKFVIIDNFAILTGSLNWTIMSITENFENVVITNNSRIVPRYADAFEFLWDLNRPGRFDFGPDVDEDQSHC